MADFLNTDIKFLKGVGDKRAAQLASEFDIHTFRDLLYYFPFRHIDRSRFYKIWEINGDMPYVQLRGHFHHFNIEGEGAKRRLTALFTDGERQMPVIWFSRVDKMRELYSSGCEYVIFGKPTPYRGTYQMAHPDVSQYHEDDPPRGFEGVYSLTDMSRRKGYTTKSMARLAATLLSHPRFSEIGETLPAELISQFRLMPLGEALRQMHQPQSVAQLQKARERMKFEELFYLQLHILKFARRRDSQVRGRIFPRIGTFFNTFYSRHLPFSLTGAQKRVLHEIRDDMRTGRQMNRLLQGDVGSGKTMVAFMTLLIACDNNSQGALMAPTEILATQHYETLRQWGEKIGINVRLLTGNTRAKERREIHEGLLDGSVNILVGTHAVIEDKVKFCNLGVAVIDEQHRFGVAQRARMWEKADVAPHVLVMTATPIPRTLAMTLYGDLRVSVIDELPPGRTPVATILRSDDTRMDAYRLLGRELAAGRQAYIVYPLVADNPKLELKSVESGFERICGIFPQYRVEYVHGRLKPDVKEERMRRFVNGEARILVATTVIEVGVNVPNASVMIIENAERFGLSQLHQLRGRVGRGAEKSYCILMSKPGVGGDTRKRLEIMTDTTDGFLISEADMRLRGPGDMEGTQQSGLAFRLQVANLATDGQTLSLARRGAEAILNALQPSELEENGEKIKISSQSADILRREMRYRFEKDTDWSNIS